MRSVRSLFLKFMLTMLLLAFMSLPAGAQGLSRNELRELFSAPSAPDALFDDESASFSPDSDIQLNDAAAQSTLARFNAVRRLAGLDPVLLDPDLQTLAQKGAILMNLLGGISHTPDRPEGLDDDFFEAASLAASNCNLAQFNWSAPSVLNESLTLFLRDDAGSNLNTLGHRRWMLYPHMKRTGFGLAVDDEGRSYVSLYVTDNSAPADYDCIAWPCEGAFPAEFMSIDTPWSISPNPTRYDLEASRPSILLEEVTSGASWAFDQSGTDPALGTYFIISSGRYGDGPAYIFRPDLTDFSALENGYEQNQLWRVTLSGMISSSGEALAPITYLCEMASLIPIDPASVELTPREITVRPGEEADVSALVYPRWADDLSFTLSLSDDSLAEITADGTIRGLAKGQCLLIAETVNGRTDEITVTITD